ncbi:ice-binding family protein [Chitinophaga sp. ARDCPP14]|uniref:ice-binding family protein n=1 Tax=Chitinophaga sp. ARDCPP14 TaxID=3391139 RepID=UPI003F5226DE
MLFCLSPQITAQTITNYIFNASTGTFTALVTPTATTWTGNVGEGISNLIPIGFDFWYMGTRYTNLSASTNGWLTLGSVATAATPVNNLLSGGAPRPVIAPLWDDLSIGVTSNVTYKTTGTTGSRVFTLQYLNIKWPDLALAGVISLQVKLYESTGKIEFKYREELVLALLTSASVGITAMATGTGNFLSINDAGSSASSAAESSVTGKPASGTTYGFTPPVAISPGTLTFSGVTNSAMTLNWTDLSSNENGFVIYRSTDGVNYNFVSQTPANTNSSSQTGLSVNTTYYWKVYAVTEGALSTALGGSRSTVNYPPLPNIGTAVNFTLFTVSGAIGNTGISNITGNIGTNVGDITGLETSSVIGSLYIANTTTAQGAVDVLSAYTQLNAIPVTSSHAAVLGNGEILTPGVYNIPAAGSIAGVLTLDAQGDPNAVFVIKIGAALTTGAGTTVSLVNGASACNVFWKAEGAVTMAAGTTMRGTLIANNGAASMGAGGLLEGRLFSTLGAVTLGPGTASLPVCPCTPAAPAVVSPLTYCQNSIAVPLTATGTTLLWERGAATAPTPATTTIGATSYAVTQTVGGCLSQPAIITVNITAGPSAVISYINSPYRSDAGTAAVARTGTVGGTYASTAGLSINSSTGLIDLATSTLGTYTVIYTIAAAAGCNQYQTTTSISIIAPPSVNLGTAANFALFAVSGGVGNTGISQVTGDIGTNLGAITGFETAIVAGSMHTANAVTSQGAADVLSAYNQLNAFFPTASHVAVLGNGETLFPGIYNLAAAGSVAATLTLDAQGNSNELFIFQIGGAFTTGAGTTVNLVNGASACNVYWKVEGAIAMAASTTMVGTLIANNGAASMAAGGILNGRMFSTLGALTMGPGAVTIPVCVMGGTWTGAVSTDWNNAGNWFNNAVPTSATNATIPSGAPRYPLLNAGTGVVKNLTILSSASVTVTDGSLQIAGVINNGGTLDVSAGTLRMTGTAVQTIPANVFAGNQIRHLTINNNAGVILNGTLQLSGVLLVSNGSLNTGGNLTLMSTVTQTALIEGSGTGEVVGNVTMQRYLASGFGYRYVSSPFQAATIGGFSNEVNLNAAFPNFYRYDENQAASGWITDTTATHPLVPMQGYAANTGASSAAMTADLTGVVNNHNISTPTLYNHHQAYTLGFNLVGNPYPSPIDWNATTGWSRTNIDNAVYYFNAGTADQYTGTYSSYINGISSDNVAGPVIAAMQGFFIHVTDGTYPVAASLTINNNARVNNLAPDFHRVPVLTVPLIRLTAGYADERTVVDPVVVYFDAAAPRFYDKEMDALKLMNTDALVPNLYIRSSAAPGISIYAWPGLKDSTEVIPLGLKTAQPGWITFNAVDIERFPAGRHIYLYDMKTGVRQDLQRQPQYRLYLDAGEYESRFFLGFQGKPPVDPVSAGGTFYAYSLGRMLYAVIVEMSVEKYEATVTNLAGKIVVRRQLFGNGHHELGSQFSNGIYIVTFYTRQQKVFTQKVFIGN